MTCEGRPTSKVAIVDKSFYNMYCISHRDLTHRSSRTLFDKAQENWDVRTKGFSVGE